MSSNRTLSGARVPGITCPQCRCANPSSAKFCVECAASLSYRCVTCGFENLHRTRFCPECGSATRLYEAQINPGLERRGLQRVERAGESYRSTDGERKLVTLLFADIKGSTALLEELDPEDARAIIDPALRLMSNAVHRYDGYVAQSTGDGILALFGAPVAHEEHPQLAVYAALALQDAIAQYSARLAAQGRPSIETRVGVNTGEAVLRTVHTTAHTEYAPVGITANLAARMQTIAPTGSTVISENTQRLVGEYFLLNPLGPVAVKGVSRPINVFEVIGAGPLRSHFELSAHRGLTKFVGREREIDGLTRALDLAANGCGQIMTVVAEAGTGKSRLLHEFKRLVPPGWVLLQGSAVSHGGMSPYQPVLEMLHGFLGIDGGDDRKQRREKVCAKLATLDYLSEDSLPYLLALLGIQDTPDPLAQMDGPVKRRRTLEALRHILLRESLDQPLLIIFEDLHWAVEESHALVDLLADSIANSRILLLVSYRPPHHHEWNAKSYHSQLKLDPLPDDSAEKMLSALLGDGANMHQLKRLIIEKTGGNPFFMEEMVQATLEQGVLVRDGSLKLAQPLTRLKIPATVHGILASRIDRLPSEEKELLQTLAIIGRRFPLSLIERVAWPAQAESEGAATASESLRPILARLQSAEFIYEQPAMFEAEFSFKHALTQEVAYGSLLSERRRHLHERAAEAIVGLFHDRLDDHLDELAYHYSRSANVEKASHYLYLAGHQAAARSGHSEALAYFADGLDLLKALPDQRIRNRLELPLQIGSAFSLRATKGFTAPEVERALVRARELCSDARDSSRLYGVLVGLHTYYLFGPRLETSGELAKQILAAAESLKDATKIATAYLALGQTATVLGKFHSSSESLERAIALGEDNPAIVNNAIGYLAATLWSLGYPDRAATRMRRALDEKKGFDRPRLAANVLAYGGFLFLRMRLWQMSRQLAESGSMLANQHGLLFHASWFAIVHGRALIGCGERDEGIAEMRHGIAGMDALGAARPFLIGYLAEGCLEAGLHREGLEVVARAGRRAEETGERWTWADLLRIRGELCLMQDSSKTAEAERDFRAAISLAEEQGAKSYELRAATSLARLLRQSRAQEARIILSRVVNWFTEGFDTADLQDAKVLLGELSC